MLDPRLFRTDLAFVQQQLARRSFNFNAELYTELELQRKEIQVSTQALQNARNSHSKAIGMAKSKGENVDALLAEVQSLGDALKEAEVTLATIQQQMAVMMESVPNFLDAVVPEGKNEEANIELSRWGDIPEFSFTPKDHVDLGASKGVEFELA